MQQLLSILISKCAPTTYKTDHLCHFTHIINNIYTKYEIFFWSILSCFIKSRTFAINIWTIIDIFLIKNIIVNFNTKAFRSVNTFRFLLINFNIKATINIGGFIIPKHITAEIKKLIAFFNNDEENIYWVLHQGFHLNELMFLHLNFTGFFRVNILLIHRHILTLPERVHPGCRDTLAYEVHLQSLCPFQG